MCFHVHKCLLARVEVGWYVKRYLKLSCINYLIWACKVLVVFVYGVGR